MRSRSAVYTVMLPALLLFWGCTDGASSEPARQPLRLTLATYLGDVSALVYLAQDMHFFDEQGLDVTISEFEAGKLATDSLVGGEAHVATAGEFVFIKNAFEHPELRIFGTVSDFRLDDLVARRDKGITLPTDLRGKRIGVLEKATSEFFLGRFLTMNDISLDEVEIVYLKPSEIVQKLLDGEIDAGQTWDPNVYRLKEALKDNAVTWSREHGQWKPVETFVLITTKSWLREHRETARRLIRSLVEAEDYVRDNPDQSMRFIATRFGLTDEYTQYVYRAIEFKVELSQSLLLAMEDETRWAIQNKLVPSMVVPNYLESIDISILDEIRPTAISIIR